MKLKAIIESRTQMGEIVLQTEPKLTGDVFDYVCEHIWGEGTADQFAFDTSTGELTFLRSLLGADDVANIETALTQAEKAVARSKDEAESEHKGFLQRVSKDSGLPLA